MKLDEYGQVVERELRFTMEVIRGGDIGDVIDGLWAGISGSRPSGQAEFHRLGASRIDPGREDEAK